MWVNTLFAFPFFALPSTCRNSAEFLTTVPRRFLGDIVPLAGTNISKCPDYFSHHFWFDSINGEVLRALEVAFYFIHGIKVMGEGACIAPGDRGYVEGWVQELDACARTSIKVISRIN